MLDRRTFFARASAAVLGWQFLAPQLHAAELEAVPVGPTPPVPPPPPPVNPNAFEVARQAVARMKQEVKPGILVVVPPDARESQAMANGLARLFGGPDESCCAFEPVKAKGGFIPVGGGEASARPILTQTVFLCLPQADVQKLVPGLRNDTRVVLLDVDSEPTAQLAGSDDLFGKEFNDKVGGLLAGTDGKRLDAVIKAQKDALGAGLAGKVDAAVRDLDSEVYATRQAATAQLEQVATRAPAVLAEALRKSSTPEAKQRLERLIEAEFLRAPADKPGNRMPFGVRWIGKAHHVCGTCGMSAVTPAARKFLAFVCQPQP